MSLEQNIGYVAKSISVLVAASFLLSVVYDWGYLFSLGLDFASIPTSLNDHIRSALVWMPKALFLIFIGTFNELINQRVEQGMTEEEIVFTSRNPSFVRKFRKSPIVFIRFLSVLLFASFLLFGDLFAASLLLAIPIIWVNVNRWLHDAPLIQKRRKEEFVFLFKWLPIVIGVVFFYGYNNAVVDTTKNYAGVEVVDDVSARPVLVNELRFYEKGMLSIDPKTKYISFLPWEKIRYIKYKNQYKPFMGLVGNWINKDMLRNNYPSDKRQ